MTMIKITRDAINDALEEAEVEDRIEANEKPLNGIARLLKALCDDVETPSSGLSQEEFMHRFSVLKALRSLLSNGAGEAMNKALAQANVAGRIAAGEHPAEGLVRIYHETCLEMEEGENPPTEDEFRRRISAIKDFRQHLSPDIGADEWRY